MSFQIYLNSASSTDFYPDNSNTSFRVQLPSTVNTKGGKVALSEICFTSDILSLPSDNFISISSIIQDVNDIAKIDVNCDNKLENRLSDAFNKHGTLVYKENKYMAILVKNTNLTVSSKLKMLLGNIVKVSDLQVHDLRVFAYAPDIHCATGRIVH
jgi:hypothetical protein